MKKEFIMKVKDIHSVFGVAPATYFDWCKKGHKKKKLATLLKNIELDEALALLEKESKEKEKPMMLLSTVNCSIGNKQKHFTLTKLKNLFYKKEDLDPYEKYALKTIKKEATQQEIEEFLNYYHIPLNRVEKVLST